MKQQLLIFFWFSDKFQMFNFLRAFSTESSLLHESFRLCDPPKDNLRGWSNSSTTMNRFSSRETPLRKPNGKSGGAARFDFSAEVNDRVLDFVSGDFSSEFLLLVKNFSMTDPMSSGSTATWLSTSQETTFGCKLFVRRFRELSLEWS